MYNKESRTKVVQCIMDHGGNINIQNNNGDTLLHLAFKRNDNDLVKFIIGAYNAKDLNKKQLVNFSIRNRTGRDNGGSGKTALDLAQDLKLTDIIDVLIAAMLKNQQLLVQIGAAKPTETITEK